MNRETPHLEMTYESIKAFLEWQKDRPKITDDDYNYPDSEYYLVFYPSGAVPATHYGIFDVKQENGKLFVKMSKSAYPLEWWEVTEKCRVGVWYNSQ